MDYCYLRLLDESYCAVYFGNFQLRPLLVGHERLKGLQKVKSVQQIGFPREILHQWVRRLRSSPLFLLCTVPLFYEDTGIKLLLGGLFLLHFRAILLESFPQIELTHSGIEGLILGWVCFSGGFIFGEESQDGQRVGFFDGLNPIGRSHGAGAAHELAAEGQRLISSFHLIELNNNNSPFSQPAASQLLAHPPSGVKWKQ